jgi:methionyl-tRNA synthetase
MSEPTIDEMLEWLDAVVTVSQHPSRQGDWVLTDASKKANESMSKAIRAILEQHRTAMLEWKRPTELEMIRAFVERVEKRIDNALPFTEFADLMRDELAAMEAEVKE